MALMSSGEFARASGLTRKALRLYDELGLLTPARVEPSSGYRFYAPAQLERARLVAWLRRLGMPLATIRAMNALSPAARRRSCAATGSESRRRPPRGGNSRPSSSATCRERTLLWEKPSRKR